MSWEEYKTKREGKIATNSITTTSSVKTANTTSSSWDEYKKKREKAREEEEERRRVEQEKQKNNIVSSTTNFTSKINTSNLEDLQKEYDKLPTAEKTKIAKEIQEETSNSMGKLGLTQNTLNTAPLTNLDEDKLTEVGSLKEKVNNLKTDASSILKNLDLSVENAILQGQKMFNVAMDKVLNDKNKLMLENAKTLSKISGDDSYNSFMDSSVSRLLTQEVDSTKGIQSTINNNNTRIQNNTDKTTNKVSEKLSEITGGAGTTIVGGALSIANPALGTAFFTTSAAGGYYDEALERGMDKDEAQVYAGIMGCMEGVTESVISAERIKGAKSILEGTGFKNAVKSFGLEVGENFLQEAVMPSISEGTALLTGGKESLKYDLSTLEGVKELLKDSLNDGIDGALSAILLGGVTRGSAKCIQVVTNLNNGLKPSKIQVEQAVREAEKSGVNTKEILKNEIVYQAEKNIDNTNNINNQNTQALQQNTAPIENIIEQNNTILPKARDSFLETAKQYNIDTNNETIQSINRIMNERGINTSFNSELFTDNSQNAIWKISKDENGEVTREVVLNPNSDSKKTLQNIVTHELIHDLEGTAEHNELRDLILKYDKKQINYEDARKSLENIYSKVYDPNSSDFQTLVENEAVADILGNKLGDQEFINNLTMKKPSLGRKIYNWVVDKLNKLTGYSNEKLFWQDVKNKFENAYRQDYQNNNNDIKYSKEVLSDGTKYIKLDNKLFQNQDGTLKTAREAYNTLVGKTLNLDDGTEVKILKSLPKKDLYNELSKRRPRSKNVENISEMNNKINGNLDESIESSSLINTRPDVNSRHIEQGIKNFDTREVYLFDGTGAYRLTLSIAELQSGEKVAYAKKNLTYDKQLTEKIKNELSPSSTSNNGRSSRMITPNNSITSSNKDVNTTTKYSMQESENNTELSEEAKKQLHRYVYMDTKQLNKAFSEAVDNKENMLMEYNALQKEYKEFQNTEEFKNALNDFVRSESPKQETTKIMNKANKYAEKLRYYNNAYETYKAQQDAINSLLMGNETDVRSAKQIVRDAEKHFGITNNFKETAYIDINGNQIDFSGKHEGGPSGARTLDHRQINEIDIDMDSFIDMGNIRILPEGGGINLKIEPNAKQYNKLHEYIDSVDGEIYIDIDKTKNTYDSAEYKKRTPTSKILSDLQYYFKNGKFPHKSEFADFRYSQNNQIWQSYLDKNYKNTGKGQTIQELKLTTVNNNAAPSVANNVAPSARKQSMNPTEIANLKKQDANTTPQLSKKTYKKGNKQSSFLSNIITDSKFLKEDLRQQMSKEDNIRYYEGITNEKTLEKAYNKLQEDGQEEVIRWHSKDSKNATAEDVAEGWILLKQYQDNGDYQSAVEVAKKMRDIGTTAGQTVQAYNILSRLTPEGMFYYAQSELNEAYNKMVDGKSKKWIEENQSKFDLTPEETQNILDIMKDVSTMEDGYDKKVKIAEVQKIITDKIPATAGQSIKAWMRISMLFNPKTQVRNVMGNTVIMPVNMFGDSVSAGIDRLISKKTGVRTTGNINIKNYGKGFGKGLYESYNDFRKGINTRNIEGNRFEVSEGKSFNNKGIGKALNRVDNLLSFMLDAGDRGFYEATFTNSLNNQMVLNNVTTPTQQMIDIATNEALQRTWQDNNKYTQSVLKIRNILNNVNVKGYGLGDVIIPFAKTPANLTKAIVDYSPAGLVKTLTLDARKFKNSLENGQYSPQLQHQFVQNLGKATVGTFLYVLSYGLAKAGIATGEADDDKDVKNFMKNSLGISSYSIKIGDKSFTYDWAQPIAAPLSIMTNIVNSEDKGKALLESVVGNIDTAGSILLEQSFLQSINEVLNDSDGVFSGLINQALDLPARAVPTFSKQIADMVDSTQRTTFEYGKPVKNAINSVVAKIPFASRTLPASIDTLGNEIQKYGGNNNVWNVMFNPANTNKGNLSKAGEEIYNVYKETGDTTIFPRTAPYYINNKNEKVTMTAEQRSKFQTISGKYVESSLTALLNDKDYKKLSNEEKANIINEIVSDSYSKAKYDVLKIDSKEYEKLRTTLENVKPATYYSYKFKTKNLKKDNEKIDVLLNPNYTNKEKTALYEQYILSSSDKQYPIIKEAFTDSGLNIQKYLEYKNQEFSADKKDDGTVNGKTVSGNKKTKVWNYIENMDITYTQKLLLYGLEYTPSDSQQQQVINYVKSLPNKTNKEKLEILSQFKGFTIYEDGTVKY